MTDCPASYRPTPRSLSLGLFSGWGSSKRGFRTRLAHQACKNHTADTPPPMHCPCNRVGMAARFQPRTDPTQDPQTPSPHIL